MLKQQRWYDMTVTLKTETPEVKIAQQGGSVPMDAIDAMLIGRNAQEPFLGWLAKRIRNIYPK